MVPLGKQVIFENVFSTFFAFFHENIHEYFWIFSSKVFEKMAILNKKSKLWSNMEILDEKSKLWTNMEISVKIFEPKFWSIM